MFSGVKLSLIGGSAGKKNPAHGRVFSFLVAGACYENYMQIDLDPFPLVA
jgi:hypothetical protein